MKDRTPKYPGRVKLTPVSGMDNVFDLVRADDPIEPGTPINKKTLLTDETAYLLELKVDNPTPDDAFSHIARNFTGDGGMNINLLEEAINMKYCKILTLQSAQTKESVFLSNALWSLGCKHPSEGWTCLVKNSTDNPNVMEFKASLPDGTTRGFMLELGNALFYYYNNSNYEHTGSSFQGQDALTIVENRPNEVCLNIAGYTTTSYKNSSSSTSYYTPWRIWAIFDVKTGEKKASSVFYYGNSTNYYSAYATYLYTLTRASMWCYYNQTYDYYYAPFQKSASSGSSMLYGYLSAMPAGNDYYGTAADSSVYSLSSFYLGCADRNNYYAGAGYFVDDQTFLYAQIQPSNYVYFYQGTLTSATAITKTSIASSSTIPTFSSSSWGYSSDHRLHSLLTKNRELYLYAVGQAYTTTTSEYNVINRYGPFTTNTTTIDASLTYKRIAGYPNAISYGNLYPMANANFNPDRLIFCRSYNMSSYENQFFQTSYSTDYFRAISPYLTSGSINGSMVGYGGAMRSAYCFDNSFSWVFWAEKYRIGGFETPDDMISERIRYWTCPEDGRYKIIMVGGGAAGSKNSGGGSGYLKVFVKEYHEGDVVPYSVGAGELYADNASSYSWMYRINDRSTYFDDEVALCASGYHGGADGATTASGGGGGGYNLVTYGGQGMNYTNSSSTTVSVSSSSATLTAGNIALSKDRNGGVSANAGACSSGDGYGAGGGYCQSGKDGVIVILK